MQNVEFLVAISPVILVHYAKRHETGNRRWMRYTVEMPYQGNLIEGSSMLTLGREIH